MKLSLTTEQVTKLLEAYYKQTEESDVKISVKIDQSENYYGESYTVGKIIRTDEITILGEKIQGENEILQEEVQGILGTLLEEEGYSIQSMHYNTGVTTDDYPGCSNYERAYFSGIELTVQKNIKEKVK